MFEKELAFFIRKQAELVKKYEGKILAIKDEEIVGVYDSTLDAYITTKKNHELGQVMLQPCLKGADAYTASISTLGMVRQ